jgi:hypothetical protein
LNIDVFEISHLRDVKIQYQIEERLNVMGPRTTVASIMTHKVSFLYCDATPLIVRHSEFFVSFFWLAEGLLHLQMKPHSTDDGCKDYMRTSRFT